MAVKARRLLVRKCAAKSTPSIRWGALMNKHRKLALVIGNSSYSNAIRLKSPLEDAAAVNRVLNGLNYETIPGSTDLTYQRTIEIVDEFVTMLDQAPLDVCLFYYSGHGLQIEGTNYIVPIDFDNDDKKGVDGLVSVQGLIDRISHVDCARIVLLDACRNGSTRAEREKFQTSFRDRLLTKSIEFDGVRKEILINGEVIQPRLAKMTAENNTFIAYATAEGDRALDGLDNSPLSPFTSALVKYMDSVDLPLSNLTSRVRQEVFAITDRQQSTWDQSSLNSPFFFNPGKLLLFTGTMMALVGLILSIIPYSFVLAARSSPVWIVLAALLPMISLGILLFGMQSAYSRLRGQFFDGLNRVNDWREHTIATAQRGAMGGFLGALLTALLIAAPYYWAWQNVAMMRPHQVDNLEPLGDVMVEITYATVFGACVLGFLTLFFARVRLSKRKVVLSSTPSVVWVIAGAVFGGALSGLIVAPIVTVYFGRLARPEVTPVYLLPGSIVGSAILVFSIVNFDLERLSTRRLWTSGLAAIAALACGVMAGGVIFGALYAAGAVGSVIAWMEHNARSDIVLAAGGAIYGIPVGVVLGVVIGAALLLTERWSGKPVFNAAEH
jgi:Caspase domain